MGKSIPSPYLFYLPREEVSMIKLQFSSQDIQLIASQKNPNVMLWSGILSYIDTPSSGIPCGADKPVVLPMDEIMKSYSTLKGTALNAVWEDGFFSNPAESLTGHNERNIIGYIDDVSIDENKLIGSGLIFKSNFPDLSFMVENTFKSLGFSVELTCGMTDTEEYSVAKDITFSGAALLFSNCAAWDSTQMLSLVANKQQNSKEKDDVNMTPEEMKAMFAEFSKGLTEEISKVQASVDQKFEALEKQKEAEEAAKLEAAKKTEDEAAVELEKLKAANAELQAKLEAAAKVIPAPTAGQTAASKDNTVDVNAEFAKINASKDMSFDDKLKARFAVALAAQE